METGSWALLGREATGHSQGTAWLLSAGDSEQCPGRAAGSSPDSTAQAAGGQLVMVGNGGRSCRGSASVTNTCHQTCLGER